MINPLEWMLNVAGLVVGLALPVLLIIGVVRWLWGRRSEVVEADSPIAAKEVADQDGIVSEEHESELENGSSSSPSMRVPGPAERMVQILRTTDQAHGYLLRALLRDQGIWAFITGDKGVISLGFSEISLHVPAGDVPEARQLIAAAEADAVARQAEEGRAICPACGYDLRATPQRCPECGLRLAGLDDVEVA